MDEYYSMIKAEHDANNAWSAEQAQKAMDYQTEMSNTAHQREVADLKAAGLNPVLSAGGSGATTGSGLQAQRSDENVTALYGLAKQAIEANIEQARAMQNTAKYSSGSGVFSQDEESGLPFVDALADWIYRKTGIKPEHSKPFLEALGQGASYLGDYLGLNSAKPAQYDPKVWYENPNHDNRKEADNKKWSESSSYDRRDVKDGNKRHQKKRPSSDGGFQTSVGKF